MVDFSKKLSVHKLLTHNVLPHILHLRAPCRLLFFSALGDEQLLKQYPIISDETMVDVWIYTEVKQFQGLYPLKGCSLRSCLYRAPSRG
jgi:hypothetical protein